ncbi:unnamed protein product [Ambrosiozyma monospora]|uniref:Unnamed protein product n=1 Tax=Ambrosiozyma monospora TaxID=43982 RepID=A0ACB5UE84_AMBMO|nr:unnamed protein product [Ambrosiozyma monospora]
MSNVARTQGHLDFNDAKSIQESWKKEVVLKPFDVLPRLLSGGSYGNNAQYNLNDKIGLYFNDMDLTPLMMHENYRATRPSKLNGVPSSQQKLRNLELLDIAANSISESDLVNNAIRSGEQQWSLLPFHAVTSCIIPGSAICGQVTSRINFASWLGQNSKANKYNRILQELQYHSSTKTMTNNQELRLTYLPFLTQILSKPLVEHKNDGIDDVLKILDEYYFTKEDWDNIMEFGVGPRDW